MIGRRTLLLTIGSALLVAPTTIAAPVPGRTYRLGVLAVTSRSIELMRTYGLPQLAERGFVEGRNLEIDAHHAPPQSTPADLRTMAEAIVRRQPDVLLAIAGAAIEAARSATTTIPLVALGAESTLRGPSVNLARPVGNVTGVVILGAELDMKRLEFLNSTLPGEGPIGVLLVPTNPYVDGRRVALAEAARAVGAQLQIVEAAMPAAYAAAFEAFRTARVRAVLVGSDPQYVRDAPTLARLAQASQLPTMCHWREMTIDGCLMSYGGNLKILWQRLGEQVARVLEKNPVSGIPIEAPMQLELVVNLRTAKTLGLNLPRDLLLRADEVIE